MRLKKRMSLCCYDVCALPVWFVALVILCFKAAVPNRITQSDKAVVFEFCEEKYSFLFYHFKKLKKKGFKSLSRVSLFVLQIIYSVSKKKKKKNWCNFFGSLKKQCTYNIQLKLNRYSSSKNNSNNSKIFHAIS